MARPGIEPRAACVTGDRSSKELLGPHFFELWILKKISQCSFFSSFPQEKNTII
jgi:hypothetical protein